MRKVSFLQMYQSTVTISEKMNLKCTAVTHISIQSKYLNVKLVQIYLPLTLIYQKNKLEWHCNLVHYPIDTGRKLNVHKSFGRSPGRNVLLRFNLRPVSRASIYGKGVRIIFWGSFVML